MDRSADGEPEEQAAQDTKPRRGRLARTREMLELATPPVAVLLTLGSALLKLAVERLPTLQPIGVVLVVFLVFLSVSAIVQLLLFWRDLATPHARAEFLRTASFGVLLVGVTVAGMLARYFWELLQSGRSVTEADPSVLSVPAAPTLRRALGFPPQTAILTCGSC